MPTIQFYRIAPDTEAREVLEPAFRRRLDEVGTRRLDPRALSITEVGCSGNRRVTFVVYETPRERFFAPINGSDTCLQGLDRQELAAAPTRRLSRPRRAAPAALPGSLGAGTRISTPEGCRPVESLRQGDRVLTRQHGPVRLLWTGRATHVARGGFAPVTVKPDTFGPGWPARPLTLSPLQPVLLTGTRAALFHCTEAQMVPAADLPDFDRIDGRGPVDIVTYYTLLLETQELIRAEGVWVSSFCPADAPQLAMDQSLRAETDVKSGRPAAAKAVAADASGPVTKTVREMVRG